MGITDETTPVSCGELRRVRPVKILYYTKNPMYSQLVLRNITLYIAFLFPDHCECH